MKEDRRNAEPKQPQSLHRVVQRLLGECRPEFVGHVKRVLLALLEAEEKHYTSIKEPIDIVAAFKRHKLIPKGLYEVLGRLGISPGDGQAVCFAACSYPNRVRIPRWDEKREKYTLLKDPTCDEDALPEALSAREQDYGRLKHKVLSVLDTRVKLFLEAFLSTSPILDILRARIISLQPDLRRECQELRVWLKSHPIDSQEENVVKAKHNRLRMLKNALSAISDLETNLYPLLSDLVGLPKELEEDGSSGRDRLHGAALYLLTCCSEKLVYILANWVDDKKLIRFIREFLEYQPSGYIGQDTAGMEFEEMVAHLGRRFNGSKVLVEEKILIRVLALEMRARGMAQGIEEVDHFVSDCWNDVYHKLTSGFPSYAFRSHYSQWWNKIVWHKKADVLNPHIPRLRTPKPNPPGPINPKLLHFHREGYRVVRSTFFAQAGWSKKRSNKTHADTHASNSARTSYAGPSVDPTLTRDLRRAIDCLYYHRWEQKHNKKSPEMAVKEIVRRFPQVGESRINNANYELKRRLAIYRQARVNRDTNEKIRDIWNPPVPKHEKEPEQDKKTPVETVSSISRVVPPENTLLWAFTCRVFLHPTYIDGRHVDEWTFSSWIAELAFWVCDIWYDQIRAGVKAKRRSDVAAEKFLGHPAFTFLLNQLKRIPFGENILERWQYVDNWIQEHPVELKELEKEVSVNLCEFFMSQRSVPCITDPFSNLESILCFEEIYHQNKKVKSLHKSWIVPAWYLVFVEATDYEQAMSLLLPNDDAVGELVSALIDKRKQVAVIDHSGEAAPIKKKI